MGFLQYLEKYKKGASIGQALAPCFCRLLCGQRACLSRTLYGDFIIAFSAGITRTKPHRQKNMDKGKIRW